MRVGKSVAKAIDEMENGDSESAMLHACNAVDGTAKRTFPNLQNRDRFIRFLRDNYAILGPMGAPGIDLDGTRFPVSTPGFRSTDGIGDLAELIYGIHRCTHGHGDELPAGFELIPDFGGPERQTQLRLGNGKVQLSDRMVFGLVAVAVLSPVNASETAPDEYFLTYAGKVRMPIEEWWGRAQDFAQVVSVDPLPSVRLDFSV